MPSAKTLLTVALAALGLSVLLGFISVFVPWSQREFKDPGHLRAFFYPFKFCVQNANSDLHNTVCEDEDFSGNRVGGIVPFSVPTSSNDKCRGYFIATVVFVFIHVIVGVFALLALAAAIAKMAKPLIAVAACLAFISFVGALLAWSMFIVYAEERCGSNQVLGQDVFPLRGYSYGWILEIFATVLGLAALLAICLGLKTAGQEKATEVVYPGYEAYSGYEGYPAYPAYPAQYATPMEYY